jgi:hypothetical protein
MSCRLSISTCSTSSIMAQLACMRLSAVPSAAPHHCLTEQQQWRQQLGQLPPPCQHLHL